MPAQLLFVYAKAVLDLGRGQGAKFGGQVVRANRFASK